MKNCLVTKFKTIVDNDDLLYFGKIRFTIDNSEATSVFGINAACTVELGTGVTLYKDSTPVGVGPATVEIGSGNYKALGTGQFFLADYDSVTEFKIEYRNNVQTEGAINALADMLLTGLNYTAPTAPNELFDLSKKQQDKAVLSEFVIGGAGLTTIGSLKEFAKLFDAEVIAVNPTGSWSFGNLTDFADFPSVTKITISNSPGLGGTVEDLVSAFVENGRSTGSIQLWKNAVTISFEGSNLSSSTWYTVTWSGADNITVATSN